MKLKCFSRIHISALLAIVLGVGSSPAGAAQSTGYRVSGLAADRPGANHQSANLLNPWGVAFVPGGQGFFISENASGRVDSYDATGNPLGGVVIPAPTGSTAPFSMPTGIVADPESNFGPPRANFQFLVAADNGTIWGITEANGVPQTAQLFVDLFAGRASYTGIAVLHPDCCAPYVAVANFAVGTIDTFAGPNTLVSLSRNQFTDPNLPTGYAPFNIQKIGDQVFVLYAQQNTAHIPIPDPGAAVVDIFDTEGNFVKRFLSPGAAVNVLDAPWGITQASENFGPFSTAILIGNVGDGSINAFDPSGNFLGQFTDESGNELNFVGLHGLAFRADGLGDPNTLYELGGATSGEAADGTFGAITTALATTTTLTAPATAIFGAPVTLTASVSSLAGIPAGTVNFFDSDNLIGHQALNTAGLASLTMNSLGVGSHSFTAQYTGSFDS
ncbi:MAG: TIGR03118 family protein, partial [Terracidiphilus sp.]